MRVDRNKYRMNANAIEETAKEIIKFHNGDMYRCRYENGIKHAGSVKNVLCAIFEEAGAGNKSGTFEVVRYDEEDGTEEVFETLEAAEIMEMIKSHKYIYDFYVNHVGDVYEQTEDEIKSALDWLIRRETERVAAHYIDADGVEQLAFEITLEDIEPGNREFWSVKGNAKPALIKKIEEMEKAAMW